LLSLRSITMSFGGLTVIDELDLDVHEREIVSVIGPNGAGKTTLFNLVTGVYAPDSGEIEFDGASLLGIPPHEITARGIARTFQTLRLFLGMDVMDNLLLGRHLHFRRNLVSAALRLRGEEIRQRERCEEIIELLDLQHYRSRRVGDCPYGVQKRVELGRALATEPRLLLRDEPASGLIAEEREEVSYWLHEMRGRFGITLLLVEHDLRFASRLATRMVALERGAKIAEGTPDEVQRHPEVVRAYLGD
jgi:branched-chain amino acid transport system ATP-binding protein